MSTPYEDKRRTNSLDVRRANIYKRISEVWNQLGDEFKPSEMYEFTGIKYRNPGSYWYCCARCGNVIWTTLKDKI